MSRVRNYSARDTVNPQVGAMRSLSEATFQPNFIELRLMQIHTSIILIVIPADARLWRKEDKCGRVTVDST